MYQSYNKDEFIQHLSNESLKQMDMKYLWKFIEDKMTVSGWKLRFKSDVFEYIFEITLKPIDDFWYCFNPDETITIVITNYDLEAIINRIKDDYHQNFP